jgi:hypothetical protein
MPVDQLSILFQYVEADKSSLNFQPNNGAVRDLEHRGILYRSSEMGSIRLGFPYSIHPNVRALLTREKFQEVLLAHTSAKTNR